MNAALHSNSHITGASNDLHEKGSKLHLLISSSTWLHMFLWLLARAKCPSLPGSPSTGLKWPKLNVKIITCSLQSLGPKKVCQIKSATKSLLVVFFDFYMIVHHEFILRALWKTCKFLTCRKTKDASYPSYLLDLALSLFPRLKFSF